MINFNIYPEFIFCSATDLFLSFDENFNIILFYPLIEIQQTFSVRIERLYNR